MAYETATQAYTSMAKAKERLNATLADLKKQRSDLDAKITDVWSTILATDRMMEALEPNITQSIDKTLGELDATNEKA